MANGGSITAADAVYMLTIPGLYPTPQQLQGYAADAAFDTEAAEPAETVKGVDGFMSYGYVPYLTKQTIMLMPNSLSSQLFEDWLEAQKIAMAIYPANAIITLKSTGRVYTLTTGVISRIVAIPGTRKVLQARSFEITWDDISPAPYAT